MSQRDQLNHYIHQVQQRLRLGVSAQGAAIVACVALVATLGIALILNAYAFPEHALTPARIGLFTVVFIALCAALAWPLSRLSWHRSVTRAEAEHPEFEQRLVTFSERERAAAQSGDSRGGLFLELLAGDTLKVAQSAQPTKLVPT